MIHLRENVEEKKEIENDIFFLIFCVKKKIKGRQ